MPKGATAERTQELDRYFETGEIPGAPQEARIGPMPRGSTRVRHAILNMLDQPSVRLMLGGDASKARLTDPVAAAAPSEAIMIGSGSPLFNRQMAAKFVEALRKVPAAGRQNPKVVQSLWDRFRTFLGPDNRLRQEISDEGLRVDTRFPNEAERWMDVKGSPITVEHPELRRAYPGLMDSLNFRNSRRGEYKGDAFYRRTSPDVRRNAVGEIVLMRPRVGDVTRLMKVSPEAMNQTHRANIVHELQHAVQIAEGFAPGSNPFMFHLLPELEQNAFRSKVKQETLDALDKMAQNRASMPKGWESISGNSKLENAIPLEFYFRQPGEAEARMVSRRLLKPSPETVPLADYDIPLNRLYRPRR